MERNIVVYMVHNYGTLAALYALQTWFVSGTLLQIPCIIVTTTTTMMMMMMMIIIIIDKFQPRTGYDGPEWEQMYSSTLPSTSALDVGG